MIHNYHLAQINVAEAVAAMDSAQMQGFVQRIDEINQLAERSAGFIWRLQTDDGDATAIRAFDNPNMLINLSVWRDLKSLQEFVYRSAHVELLRNKQAWFKPPEAATQALWWVPAGHRPELPEGREKLALLARSGPSPEAFTFKQNYTADAAHEAWPRRG